MWWIKHQKNEKKGTVIPIDTKDSKQRVENCSLLQVFHQALNELSSAQLNIDLFNKEHNQDSMDMVGTNWSGKIW